MKNLYKLSFLFGFGILFVVSCATTDPSRVTDEMGRPNLGTEELVQALDIWEDYRQDEKEGLLLESLDIHPSAFGYHLLAQHYLGKQRYPQAHDGYTNAITLDPSFARGFYERGLIGLWHLPDLSKESALDDLRVAFSLDQTNPGYGITLADQLKWNKDTFQEALDIYEILTTGDQDDPVVFIEYSKFLLDQNMTQDIPRIIQRALELTRLSENPYHRGSLIVSLFRVGFTEEAEEIMSSLITSEWTDYWLFAGLGTELVKNGYFSAGYRALVKAFEIQGYFEHDHGFYGGMAEVLTIGTGDLLQTYVHTGSNAMYLSVSEFVLARLDGASNTDELYQTMVEKIESEWGLLSDKRNHVPWLDGLLYWIEG